MNRRSAQVVLTLLVTAMVVAAVPAQVSAASGMLVVGSQHTDFGTGSEAVPQTTTNLTIDGSGQDATVSLADADTIIDNFEDGDISEYTGDTGSATVQSSTVLEGSQTLEITSNSATIESTSGLDAYPQPGDTISVDAQLATDSQSVLYFGTSSAEWQLLVFEDGRFELNAPDGSTFSNDQASFPTGTPLEYRIHWFDNQSMSVDVYDGNTKLATVSGSSSTGATGGRFALERGGFGGTVYFDDIRRVDYPASASYTSAVHNISNAEQAAINITQASNVSVDATVRTDGGTELGTDTITSTGNHTITLADTSNSQLETVLNVTVTGDNPEFELSDESILFHNYAPVVDNSSGSPSGSEKLTSKGVTLSIDVNDSQFASAQEESLNVDFQTKAPDESSFTTAGTDTVTSNGTASTALTDLVGGTHEWRVVVSDDYGATTTSDTFSFHVPDQLLIRNVSNTSESITSTAEVTFLAQDTIVENTTNDGSINLTGLPVEETMVVEVTASNYHTRTTIIESIYEQQTIYMLNTSKSSVEVRFTLEDNTGEFDADSSYLIVERPLTINGTTNWVTVTGDYFGVNGFTTDLEDGQRYRLSVKNGVGDERVLGTYTASASETVQLTIGEVTSLPGGCDCTVTHNATYDDSGATTYVRYDYNDTLTQTSELHVKIFEKGNESNVLFPNTTYTDLGTVAVVEEVPAAQNETTWAVDVTGVRDGESFAFKKFVGPRSPALPSLPGWVKAIISIGSIWIVAGLFSQLNGNVGAVATAGLGGMWWYVDFLPQETGIGVVVLSLITAGILMVQSQRGGV